MDRLTDGPTDRRTFAILESLLQLKNGGCPISKAPVDELRPKLHLQVFGYNFGIHDVWFTIKQSSIFFTTVPIVKKNGVSSSFDFCWCLCIWQCTSLRDKSIGIIQVLSYPILLKYQLQFFSRTPFRSWIFWTYIVTVSYELYQNRKFQIQTACIASLSHDLPVCNKLMLLMSEPEMGI